jgi:hypothetical protein
MAPDELNFENCIDKTILCHWTCLEAFDIEMVRLGCDPVFANVLLDTARASIFCHESLLYHSSFLKDICRLSIKFYDKCAEQCRIRGYTECADTCRMCSDECERLANF